MKLPFKSLEFFFEENEVGIFETFKYPTDGNYKYEPYRGPGHYEMWKIIKEKGFAVCYYANGNEKISFKVEDSGEYGKLILSEFRKEIIQK
jgi:hypothetical protein